MENKVYTYYESVSDIDSYRIYLQTDLIKLCSESWLKNGWELVVIGEKYARNHPFYQQYKEVVLSLPTVNPKPYDYHCFMRWLAMANIGGGIMIDYDVVNLGLNDPKFFSIDELKVYQAHIPCVVSGTSDEYLRISKSFCDLVDDNSCIQVIDEKRHTSDMLMLASGKIKFKKTKEVANYPSIAPLVHISQSSCEERSKIEIMRELICK
jgi:hypothetical protein